jgi:hypothetical protein
MLSHAFPHRTASELRTSCLWYEKLRAYPLTGTPYDRAAEPTLREMLDDPIIQDLMRSDRVSRGDVESIMAQAAAINRELC